MSNQITSMDNIRKLDEVRAKRRNKRLLKGFNRRHGDRKHYIWLLKWD